MRKCWPRGVSVSCLFLTLTLCLLFSAESFAWNEDDFRQKRIVVRPFSPVSRPGDISAQTLIGSPHLYIIQKRDTLLDIARHYDLGYNELTEAHPDMNPWVPQHGTSLSVPTYWILPSGRSRGVIVNIPEMRLYYFPSRKKNKERIVITLPVGLGREDWPTPQTRFRVRGKTRNPTWVIPESIKKERIAEKGWSEDRIMGGAPDNPLGKYRIELILTKTKGAYSIHDTNTPWAVGRLVTHGCIRLYPEDIKQFFDIVQIGSPGELVYQPIKMGVRHHRVYAEVHNDIYDLIPNYWEEAQKVMKKGGWAKFVDQSRLARVVQERTGVPVDVTKASISLGKVEDDEERG